jgi:hypothetical protein
MKSLTAYIKLIVLACCLSGCAFREMPERYKLVEQNEFMNLYSRNFIIATPTATANAICAPIGAIGMLALVAQAGPRASNNLEGILTFGGLLGGGACGLVVGAPFIPLSYLCDENPWHHDDTGLTTSWTCKSKQKAKLDQPRIFPEEEKKSKLPQDTQALQYMKR